MSASDLISLILAQFRGLPLLGRLAQAAVEVSLDDQGGISTQGVSLKRIITVP